MEARGVYQGAGWGSEMGVRWVSDGCQMCQMDVYIRVLGGGVRWVSDGYQMCPMDVYIRVMGGGVRVCVRDARDARAVYGGTCTGAVRYKQVGCEVYVCNGVI